MSFLPKSFIETAEGLLFAVVTEGLESGKVRCFLRYVRHKNGQWRKVQTDEANDLLAKNHPDYCFHSSECDAFLHAVSIQKIITHHRPKNRLIQMLAKSPKDEIENDCVNLCRLFEQTGIDLNHFGVTGSLLIKQQKSSSDIDLVCDNLTTFHQCRLAVLQLSLTGELGLLSEQDWQDSYERRDCDLSFEDYVWHEVRKGNKARRYLSKTRKIDNSNKSYRRFTRFLLSLGIQTLTSNDSKCGVFYRDVCWAS